jgi:hypothetical protein
MRSLGHRKLIAFAQMVQEHNQDRTRGDHKLGRRALDAADWKGRYQGADGAKQATLRDPFQAAGL